MTSKKRKIESLWVYIANLMLKFIADIKTRNIADWNWRLKGLEKKIIIKILKSLKKINIIIIKTGSIPNKILFDIQTAAILEFH